MKGLGFFVINLVLCFDNSPLVLRLCIFQYVEKDEKELDAGEETMTREFLKVLDVEEHNNKHINSGISIEKDEKQEIKYLLLDLGNGLGPVIQTKDGGFMASKNPFNDAIVKIQGPKLALQISKPFVLRDPRHGSGIEVFQRLAAVGVDELCSKLTLMAAMDELLRKTAGQIAFEGIASAIISGRNKERASSSAKKSIGAVKRMSICNMRLTLLVIIQLRDPLRQHEAVGAPLMALIQAIKANHNEGDDEERRYKVISTHFGGLKVSSGDEEKFLEWREK